MGSPSSRCARVRPNAMLGSVVLVALLLGAAPLQAQSQDLRLRAGRPHESRSTPTRSALPANASAWLGAGDPAVLEALILDSMQTKHIPGLQAAIVKDGNLYWSGSFGLADPSLGVPVEESTLFMLASISKTVTGTALMQLVDEQLVGLDDPVNDHLPFAVQHPTFPGTDITVRMLLTHTSGLRDNWGVMPYSSGDPTYPLQDYLHDYLTPGGAIYNPNQNFHAWEPGSSYSYCNNGLALVGLIVQHVTGTAFPQRCASHVFAPLGMTNSAWFLSDLDPTQVAMPCRWNGSAYVSYGHYGYSDYPSGQLRTSAVQLARFLAMAIQQGEYDGATLLQPATSAAMQTVQLPAIDPRQGLVWYSWVSGGRLVWGHGGGDQGVTTEMWFDPATGIGVVVLTNAESYVPDVVDALFDYGEVFPGQTSLTTNVDEISAGLGGAVHFTLRGGSINAGRTYVVLGSLSGTQPGTLLPGGLVELPLQWDPVTNLIVSAINTAMFPNFYGQLGAGGVGRAAWDTLGPLPPVLVGLPIHFAAALKGPWDFASNPVEIAITP